MQGYRWHEHTVYDSTKKLSKPESPKMDLIPFQFGYRNVACMNLSHWVLHETAALYRE